MKAVILICAVFFIVSAFSTQQTLFVGHCEIYNADSTVIYSVVKVIDADSRVDAQRLFNGYIIKTYPKGHLDFNTYFINEVFNRSFISHQNPFDLN